MRARWLALVVCSAGCVPQPRGPRLDEAGKVAALRQATESFLHTQASLSWQRWLDGASLETGPEVDDQAWLFAPPTIDMLRRAMRVETDRERRRALHHLHALLVGEHLKLATVALDQRLWDLQRTRVAVDQRETSARDLSQTLAAEPDPHVRQRLASAVHQALDAMPATVRAREAKLTSSARNLGYDDRLQLSSELRHYDLRPTAKLANDLLDQSEALYLQLAAEISVVEAATPLSHLRPADLPALFAAGRYRELFAADGLLPAMQSTLAELGVNLDDLQIHIDLRPLANKHPRAACFPVRIPDDIRVSVRPASGAADYAALFHEIGHALQFAMTKAPAFELQVLGDASAAEAYAFVFESLTEDPAWLADHMALAEPALSAFVRLAVFKRLVAVRRHAARLLTEVALQTGQTRDRDATYLALMARAYGLPPDAATRVQATTDIDPFVEAADYLRGAALGALIRERLRREHGARWWHRPEALDDLRALWAAGQTETADELWVKLDGRRLGPEPLMRLAAEQIVMSSTP
ncbi:MAG: hypothetical protein HY903_24195 [Deltaproteobacteria bacterium]|nr:hypothetical protein [Deltaproteobacteria bacterium]